MENFHSAASQLYVNTRKRISEKNQDIDKCSIPIPFIIDKRYFYAFCIILHSAQWNDKSKIIIRPCFNLSSSRSSKFLLILLCTNKNLDPNERKKKKGNYDRSRLASSLVSFGASSSVASHRTIHDHLYTPSCGRTH